MELEEKNILSRKIETSNLNGYSMRVRTKEGVKVYNNLQISNIPVEGYWYDDEFDYGDKLE